MKVTNKLNLPETLVRAVQNHEHTGGDYSASMLTNSPRMVWLKRRHDDEVSEDVSDRIWAILGTAVHAIIESAEDKNELTELHFMHELKELGVTFSGTMDSYTEHDGGTVWDWKVDTVWSWVYGSRDEEREIQLNMYAMLLRLNNFEVHKLKAVSLFRDWVRTKATYDQSYPTHQVMIKEYRLWSLEEQLEYLNKRLGYFEQFKDTPDDELPECTKAEIWQDPDKYAVKKPGTKKAVRVLDSESEAIAYAEDKKMDKYEIEHRKSEPKRCASYCAAAPFCNQFQRWLSNNK